MARRSPPRELSCPRAAKPRPAREITLLEVHRAVVGAKHEVIDLHAHPNPRCPVGRNIHRLMDGRLTGIQAAMEQQMAQTTLAQLLTELRTVEAAS